MQDKNSIQEAKTSRDESSETLRAAEAVGVEGQPTHHWEFNIEDRGFRVRGSYQDELGGNVEVTRNGQPFKTFTYPGYRIWNVAAHFRDYVDQWLAEQDEMWREAETAANTQATATASALSQ